MCLELLNSVKTVIHFTCL